MERDVLVVGEALVDIVKARRRDATEYAGGSAANVAVALSRLGRPVRFATSYADDARGKRSAEFLARDGVVLATDPAAVERTSTAVATIGNDGAAATSSTSTGGSTRCFLPRCPRSSSTPARWAR